MDKYSQLVRKLKQTHFLSKEEMHTLLYTNNFDEQEYLRTQAQKVSDESFQKGIYIRGLIEFTNYCRNNCYYCGIRCANSQVERYRLSREQILQCTQQGYELGFRTFVLQGGEDSYFTDERLCDIVQSIKQQYPDAAVTLSVGERCIESYRKLKEAGVDRYLLRHETADTIHYQQLHPSPQTLEKRMQCLQDLKALGYQCGCGFMVGSPNQTWDTLWQDLQFIHTYQPEMVGIGPFIPHHQTPFAKEESGSVPLTLRLLSVLRLMNPHVLLPATTALSSLLQDGRIQGILAGANVIMPNLSPSEVRASYALYDHKAYSGLEAAESIKSLQKLLHDYDYHIEVSRGDYSTKSNKEEKI